MAGFFSEILKTPSVSAAAEAQNPSELKQEKEKKGDDRLAELERSFEVRLAQLSQELARERERSLSYEIRFREMEAARGEVERMFKEMTEKASRERMERELELTRSKAMERVEFLEKQVQEFQKTVMELVRLAFSSEKQQKRENSHAAPDYTESLAVMAAEIARMQRSLSEALSFFSAETRQLQGVAESIRAMLREISSLIIRLR